MRSLPRFVGLALAPLALACQSSGPHTHYASPEPSAGSGMGSAVVLQGEELRAGETLLRSLVGRMANLEVMVSNRGCPEVHLRGRQSIKVATGGPSVYVDGARAVNTCVLDEIAPSEVRRVEVYPMGVRSGYASDRNGLILIFMRDGNDG